MKKIISIFLTLCMILACMFTVVACGGNNNNNSSNNNPDSQQSTTSENGGNSSVPTSSSSVWDSIMSTDRPKHEWQPATDLVLGANDGTQATTVFLVGDSTVCQYNYQTITSANGNHPKWGYGTWFDEFLNDKVTVKNLALSGRSSRDFLTVENGENYNTFKNEIKAGDYLVIDFGHNDQKPDERYTNPNSQVTDNDSFKYYLYNYYIKVAIDAGATPILCTPIVRRSPKGQYTGERIHVTAGTGVNCLEGGDYAKAIVELGQEFGITVIDLLSLTKEMMIQAGNEGSATYYATNDNTHVNAYGAKVIAYNFMLEIQKTENTFKKYIDTEKLVAPTEDLLKLDTYTPTSTTA